MISVNELRYCAPHREILTDITFHVSAGEAVLLAGPSGSGKTTLLRLIAGLETPTAGTVSIKGTIASQAGRIMVSPYDRNIGMVFQDFALWPHMNIVRNVTYALTKDNNAKETAMKALSALEVDHLADRYPPTLSGGEMQRVAIARALAPRPKILLLDEPLSNIEKALREKVANCLRAAIETFAPTMLFVSHIPEEIEELAGRSITLENGRLRE